MLERSRRLRLVIVGVTTLLMASLLPVGSAATQEQDYGLVQAGSLTVATSPD
jgi:hypothetical protein